MAPFEADGNRVCGLLALPMWRYGVSSPYYHAVAIRWRYHDVRSLRYRGSVSVRL